MSEDKITEVRMSVDEHGDIIREIPVEQLIKAQNAQEVKIPYAGSEYLCPNCEQTIPTRKQRNMAKPAKYAHVLADVQRCPFCSFTFAYLNRAVVVRE